MSGVVEVTNMSSGAVVGYHLLSFLDGQHKEPCLDPGGPSGFKWSFKSITRVCKIMSPGVPPLLDDF